MIRLARFGKIKHPSYRIVVSDKRKDTLGTYLESLGTYNPHRDPAELTIDKDRLAYWVSKGAQLSDTLYNLCIERKLIEGKKRSMMHKKEPVAEEKKETAAKPAEDAKPQEAPKDAAPAATKEPAPKA